MKSGSPGSLSILTAQRGDMCYCPGCSHAAVLEHLGRAIDRMNLRPEDVCIVSDIGCIGTADKYFACHTFHGLHGRSLTYAEGIKRIRPDMTVIVLIGDGGCGIGTAHLVHSARRGIGIKVIVCNNFNFGMTGGQHSPTTPPHMQTTTTPTETLDRPFDICQTVIVNGAMHVGRYSALDSECSTYIESLLRAPGFGLLDLWELCVAYFVPENKLKPAALAEISRQQNLPFGLLCSTPEPVSYLPKRSAPDTTATHDQPATGPSVCLRWPRRTEICVAGSAGQRIRSAAGVIGEIAVAGGLFAAQLDDFPITVRKGHSISCLILDDHAIRHIGVDDPDMVILLSAEGAARLGPLDQLKPHSYIIADQSISIPNTSATVRTVDLTQVEKQTGKGSVALAVLAIGLLEAGWIDTRSLQSAAAQSLQGRYRADNLRAIEYAATTSAKSESVNRTPITDLQESRP
jgi:2-oxoglutarate/2-oxoacid ferredoxin oxidoreductase subunit beta